MAQLKIAIAGANGRMGRTLVQAVEANPNTILVGAQARAYWAWMRALRWASKQA